MRISPPSPLPIIYDPFLSTDTESVRELRRITPSIAVLSYFTQVSAGNDCAVIFQRYNVDSAQFEEPPIKFNERSTGQANQNDIKNASKKNILN